MGREKILIVDDAPTPLRALGELLKDDYDLYTATNGQEAIKRAGEILPDLVLLDVMMPGMDGYAICSTLKKDPATADIPVLFITAKSEPNDIVRGFEAGGHDYIAKPFNPRELFARIRTHLELRRSRQDLRSYAEELERRNEELNRVRERLEVMARIDPLTGLANRRYALERLSSELSRSARHGDPFSLAMADIDDFKQFNDTHGHEGGDTVLKSVADIFVASVRKEDMAARWGGEEFLLIFPRLTMDGTMAVAEKLRAAVEAGRPEFKRKKLKVTVTIGVAEYDISLDLDANISRADGAMYEGKRATKNCVIAARPTT
ncbi:MAG: diguanylate cyclase [Spirochaetes bacterium]|jgi:diguanylate cyclase (GGDEF)-like protein|nr:diguanylate cyclase [Spirochaetota bacterium]